ncbi:MAG: type 2 isopentenyl-diphosphate Delta-isomerase [Deltaproteobacteria bacterium]|nr:type 2 isopentenyl-diphosphate Delta-isomerase [Deltaproteobacteria bacterium]
MPVRRKHSRPAAAGRQIRSRKELHIEICAGDDSVQSPVPNGLERYRFSHEAVPEVDLTNVDTSTRLFRKTLQAPLMISPMTGGTPLAHRINLNLAEAAEETGIAMGVGSQRSGIVNPELAYTYQVRKAAPSIFLFANLGAVQLNYGFGADECRRAVEMIEADALFLHLNPLQEALQEGGDTNFAGLLEKIEKVCRSLSVPVFAREVSSGISERSARRLISAGIAGLDTGGLGGTNWALVEGAANPENRNIARLFGDWGHDVASSLINVRNVNRRIPLIASGGLRNGREAATAIGLGATLASTGGGLLNAARKSSKTVSHQIGQIIRELRVALFCAGFASANEARGALLSKSSSAMA